MTGGWRSTGGVGIVQEEGIINIDNLSSADQFKTKVRELGKERWSARKILMSELIDNIIKSIKDGSAVGVSDGSFKLKFGTACWIIEDGVGTERIIGLIDDQVPVMSMMLTEVKWQDYMELARKSIS